MISCRCHKTVLVFILTALLGFLVGLPRTSHAFNSEITVSTPNPNDPNQILSIRLLLGVEELATDNYDTAWDVVAIQSGGFQAFFSHPEFAPGRKSLWRDTRNSAGLPKQWDLEIITPRAGTQVTLNWSPTDFPNLPTSATVLLVDTDSGFREQNMRTASSYTYFQDDPTSPHRLSIVLDESGTATPPPDDPPRDDNQRLTILNQEMPTADLGSPFTVRFGAQGGQAPYRWEIISGGLPPGLSLDGDTGTVTGRSRRPGPFQFVLRLTDTNGEYQDKAFTITVRR